MFAYSWVFYSSQSSLSDDLAFKIVISMSEFAVNNAVMSW